MFVAWLVIVAPWTRKSLTIKKCDANTSEQDAMWTRILQEKTQCEYKYVDVNDYMVHRYEHNLAPLKEQMQILRRDAAEMMGEAPVWSKLAQVHVTSYGCLDSERLCMS